MSLLKPFRSVIPVANNDTATYYVSLQPVACGPTGAKFVSANLTFQPSSQTLSINKSTILYGNTRSKFNLTPSLTPPLNPKVGDLWYDTSTDIQFEYIFDGVNNQWVDITSPVIPGIVQFVYRTASGVANANIAYALADSVNNYSNVIEFSISTANFTDGSTIYWRDIGTANNTPTNIRFAGAANSGNLVIYNNSNTLSRIAIDDGGTFLPNVTTNLQIGFYSCASFINFIGASNAVPIIDNSTPNYPFPMTYLIVGGGGGGGGTGLNPNAASGGGGGGGGFRTATGPGQVGLGIPFQIIVGFGGAGGTGATVTGQAGNGGNTSIITPITAGIGSSCQLIAYGGGGAGFPAGLLGGGSGGGGGGGQRGPGATGTVTGGAGGPSCPTSYFPNQFGNPGGPGAPSIVPGPAVRNTGGAGGGGGANTAGSPGTAGTTVPPGIPSGVTGGSGGNGGDGRLFPHTGLTYGGGGGGGAGWNLNSGFFPIGGVGGVGGGGQGSPGSTINNQPGTPGLGGGGGGAALFSCSPQPGRSGGSGTVIIIVPTPSAPRIANRTGTVSISTPALSPGNTVFTWTSNGSFST
jgi:hypothetical protein